MHSMSGSFGTEPGTGNRTVLEPELAESAVKTEPHEPEPEPVYFFWTHLPNFKIKSSGGGSAAPDPPRTARSLALARSLAPARSFLAGFAPKPPETWAASPAKPSESWGASPPKHPESIDQMDQIHGSEDQIHGSDPGIWSMDLIHGSDRWIRSKDLIHGSDPWI